MLRPSVWLPRLWPLLVVLNSSACGSDSSPGCSCDPSKQRFAAAELSIGPSPLEFCWNQGNEVVLVGTLLASVGAEGTDALYVRPNASVPVRIEVKEEGQFREVPPGGRVY